MNHCKVLILKAILFLGFFLFGISTLYADDPGIHKTRLIAQNDSTYIFEVDVTNNLIWAIKPPILPERFRVSNFEYIPNGSTMIARCIIRHSASPLTAEDEILLPWSRNGADLTMQDLRGNVKKSLFIRGYTGIIIPMDQFIEKEIKLFDLMAQQSLLGLKLFSYLGIIPMLLLVWFRIENGRMKLKSILYVIVLVFLGMPLAEIGLDHVPLYYALILAAIALFLGSYYSLKNDSRHREFYFIFAITGLLLGLGYYNESQFIIEGLDYQIIGLFSFLTTLVLASLLFVFFLKLLSDKILDSKTNRVLGLLTGAWSVSILFIVFGNLSKNEKLDIFDLGEGIYFINNYNSSDNEIASNQRKNVGASSLTSPIMYYLTVDPFEIREEILINAREAVRLLGIDDRGKGSIPIKSQEVIKSQLLLYFKNKNVLKISDASSTSSIERADFVTLSTAGVLLRDKPLIEDLDQGIIGLSFVHETAAYPEQVSIDWQIFSSSIKEVAASVVDNYSSSEKILLSNDSYFDWKNTYVIHANTNIKKVKVEKRYLPYLSIAILFIVVFYWLVLRKKMTWKKKVAYIPWLLLIALVVYPFIRFNLDLPGLSRIKPGEERSIQILEHLLGNVYKSFDVRNESVVYDRLEQSVTGDQLSKIYLENRKSLAFENRGGAHAKVDDLKIIDVISTKYAADNKFVADTEWLVSGSVNHFGHTHYRRNRYRALVTFLIVDDIWKIKDIELIEEKRLM